MGYTSYNSDERSTRASAKSYFTAPTSATFTQMKEGKAHNTMTSVGVELREARDSKAHPNTFPIIFCLDLTGSMGHIPEHLVRDGLPTLMSNLIQKGIPDPALLFLGVGDHECDREPLQVAQFESGDAELDMWLTRTFLEGGGGGNEGESYGLATYFAAKHTVTDSWEKRKKKGVMIIVGDEPNLKYYSSTAMKEVMGNGDIKGFTDVEILEEAQKTWEIYFIHPTRNYNRHDTLSYWKQILGEKYIEVKSAPDVIQTSIELILEHGKSSATQSESPTKETKDENKDDIVFL